MAGKRSEEVQFLQDACGVSASICLSALDSAGGDVNTALNKCLELAPDPEGDKLRAQAVAAADAAEAEEAAEQERVRMTERRKQSKQQKKKSRQSAEKEAKKKEEAAAALKVAQAQARADEERAKERDRARADEERAKERDRARADKERERERALERERARAEKERARAIAEEEEMQQRAALEEARAQERLKAKALRAQHAISEEGSGEDLQQYKQELDDEVRSKEESRAEAVFQRHADFQRMEDRRRALVESFMLFEERASEAKQGSEEQVELQESLRKTLAELEQVKRDMEAMRQERDEAKRAAAAASSAASSSSAAPAAELKPVLACPRPPVVCVYVRSDVDEAEAKSGVAKVRALFTLHDVQDEDVRVLDVTHDYEFQRYLQERLGGKLAFPTIFVRGQPVGGLAELMAQQKAGKIEELLQEPPSQEEAAGEAAGEAASAGGDASSSSAVAPAQADGDDALTLGVLDTCLNVGEYVVSGVSSVVWLPVTLLTWPFRSSNTPEKGVNDVDFPVISSNWYYRNQHRILRFSDELFTRIHPRHLDVRAIHRYDTIARIALSDKCNMVFFYKDNSSPDYFRATAAHVQEIIALVLARSKSAVAIDRSAMEGASSAPAAAEDQPPAASA